MAFLYASSRTWRRIVDGTARHKGLMLAFAATCVAVPYVLGDQVMAATSENAARKEGELERKLRSQAGRDAQVGAACCLCSLEYSRGSMRSLSVCVAALDGEPPPHLPPLQMLAKAQRERLQVMLDEIRGGGGAAEARYKAALDGQSLGTHSSGSTSGAVSIKGAAAAGGQAAVQQPAVPPVGAGQRAAMKH